MLTSELLLVLGMKYGLGREIMASQRKIVAAAVAIISVLAITTAWALLQTSKTIPSTGTIYSYKLGVYTDIGCTIPISQINWTTVNPGGTTNQVVYVRNEAGNLNMNLSMQVNTWTPSPANSTNVATIAWDKTGTVLTPGTNSTATITLSVVDNAETQAGLTFTVNIKIIGDQV